MQGAWTCVQRLPQAFKLPITSDVGHSGVQDSKSPPHSHHTHHLPRRPRKQTTKRVERCELIGHSNEVEVLINGRKCMALLDTGSMVTTVSQDFYEQHLKQDCVLQRLDRLVKVTGAGGNDLPYSGFIEVVLCAPLPGAKSVVVPTLVMPTEEYTKKVPVVIGTNCAGILAEGLSDGRWTAASDRVTDDDVQERTCNVYSLHDVHIPARGSVVLTARICVPNMQPSGMIQGCDSLPGGLMVPRGYCVVDQRNHLRLQVDNMSERPITIPKRQRVAEFVEADLVEECKKPEVEGREEGPSVNVFRHGAREVVIEPPAVDISQDLLTEEQRKQVADMLERWTGVFAASSIELGKAQGVYHEIKLTDEVPFREKTRRVPPGLYEEIRTHLQDMLACGAIRHSSSPWLSNVVIVRKKDGTIRLCIDYRRLNSRTVRDAYSIPKVDETFDKMAGSKWFTSLDLQSGYWQVEVAELDKAKTAFKVGDLGFYECNRMPFGLTNSPSTFQRLMEGTLDNLPNVLVFIDDILIYSETFEEHIKKLEEVFDRLQKCGLKLKPKKCHLFKDKVQYLGHIISEAGVQTDETKINVVKEWPVPTTAQELRSALGFFGYYRRFVEHYAHLVQPLNDILKGQENTRRKNKTTPVHLDEKAKKAFESIKERLITAPILAFADFAQPFELHIDASQCGLGAVLYQKQDGKSRVVAYASRGLKKSEASYSAHKLEYLGLKWAVTEKFYDYLYGNKFCVFTDNNPLSYVLTTAKLDATGHRWLSDLAAFDFEIKYRSGKSNTDADILSRLPERQELTLDRDVVDAVCNMVTTDVGAVEMIVLGDEIEGLEEEMSSLSNRDWSKKQYEDPAIRRVVQLKREKKYIKEQDRKNFPIDMKAYAREWDRLVIRNGVLYREREAGQDTVYQLVLPMEERKTALEGLHDKAGHFGVDRTLELVRNRFFWPKMMDDVHRKVHQCERCIKRKTVIPDRAPLVNIKTSQPLELVCIDYLTLEPSRGGVENVLVITDHYTRYATAIPTRNQTAKTTAQALSSFFMTYGFPKTLHSDQGRNFESLVIKEMCKMLGIVKSHTTPYHPMGNGQCERFNRTLMNMIGTLPDHQKDDWKQFIQPLVHSYNASKHDSTGYSPFFLMYGRHPRLPIDIAMGVEPAERQVEKRDYVQQMRDRLRFAYDIASQYIKKQEEKGKKQYDKKVRGAVISVGDRVLVKNLAFKGRHKLANRWEEDIYEVVEQPNTDVPVFVVKKEGRGRATRTLHRNLLLPVNYLPLPEDVNAPRIVAKPQGDQHPQEPQPEEIVVQQSDSSDTEDSDGGDDENGDVVWVANPTYTEALNPEAPEFQPKPQNKEEENVLVRDLSGLIGEQRPNQINQTNQGNNVIKEIIPNQVDERQLPRRSDRRRRQPDRYRSEDYK